MSLQAGRIQQQIYHPNQSWILNLSLYIYVIHLKQNLSILLKNGQFLITLSDIRKLNTLVSQQRKTGIFHRLSVIYFKSECVLGILNI